VLTLVRGTIPPTINVDDPDPACDLNCAPGRAVQRDVEVALSNSFGFGGHNVSLLVGRYTE
jgi:3-oxoacyl-[acyl-carrier-protein] synthase II